MNETVWRFSTRRVRQYVCAGVVIAAAAAAADLGAVVRHDGVSSTSPVGDTVPPWFVQEIEHMTRDGGTWVTDNREFRGAADPYLAYGITWVKGVSGIIARGRLYGIDEQKAEHDFWDLILYWDPMAGKAVAMQVNRDGTFATGELVRKSETQRDLIQQFWRPDGASFQFRHLETRAADEQRTETFIRSGAGEDWQPQRTRIWKRVRP